MVHEAVCGRSEKVTSHFQRCCQFPHDLPRKMLFISLLFYLFFFNFSFLFYFIFNLYIIVLVLPNIKMNPPQVYMCSPS